MVGSGDEYSFSADPNEIWGEPDTTPEMYNEHITLLGSNLVVAPEYHEPGLDRDLGAGAGQLLEGDRKINIADLLVDREVWAGQSNKPDKLRNERGWDPIDFVPEDGDRHYQGFLRPEDDLGWDVVMKTYKGPEPDPSRPADLALQADEVQPQEEKNYHGFFLPHGGEFLN